MLYMQITAEVICSTTCIYIIIFKLCALPTPFYKLILTLKMPYVCREFLFLVHPVHLSRYHTGFSLTARIVWVCL